MYVQPVAGGTYEHRSWACETHGDNVPFYRAYKTTKPYQCVACVRAIYACPTVRVYPWTRVIVARGQWLSGLIPK